MGEQVTPIAGMGTLKGLKDAERLAAQYGGEPADCAKIKSSTYEASDLSRFRTHWYKNIKTGQTVEFKTKLGDD